MHKEVGIVLQRIKYSDNQSIVKILSRHHGLIAAIYRNSRKNKSLNQYYQPGNILEFDFSRKPNKELFSIKESSLSVSFHTIGIDISKTLIITFLAEVLAKSYKGQGNDTKGFDRIVELFIQLDNEENEKRTRQFHLLFLTELFSLLGIQPENQQELIAFIPPDERTEKTTEALELLLSKSSEIIDEKEERRKMLECILSYYQTHIPELGSLKSLKVLEEVGA